MLIGHIRGATHILRGPADMDNCADLPVIRDEGRMVSAWLPTPEELRLLNSGQPVYLHIWGSVHPPVVLTVPED